MRQSRRRGGSGIWGRTWSGFLCWGSGDQDSAAGDSRANAGADEDDSGEKSGESGCELVLDIAVGHNMVPFRFDLMLHKLICEDANNIAQGVPVPKNDYITNS